MRQYPEYHEQSIIAELMGSTHDETPHDHPWAGDRSLNCPPPSPIDRGDGPRNGVGENLENDDSSKPPVQQVEAII